MRHCRHHTHCCMTLSEYFWKSFYDAPLNISALHFKLNVLKQDNVWQNHYEIFYLLKSHLWIQKRNRFFFSSWQCTNLSSQTGYPHPTITYVITITFHICVLNLCFIGLCWSFCNRRRTSYIIIHSYSRSYHQLWRHYIWYVRETCRRHHCI